MSFRKVLQGRLNFLARLQALRSEDSIAARHRAQLISKLAGNRSVNHGELNGEELQQTKAGPHPSTGYATWKRVAQIRVAQER